MLKYQRGEKMQLKILLKPEKQLCIPFNYQYQLQSAIYAKLAEINASNFWHDNGFGSINKFKAFCFGPLKGEYTVSDKKLCFSNNVSLEIRSPIFDFCNDFQRAVELFPSIKLFDTKLNIINAGISNQHINENYVRFSAVSPITVYKTTDDGKTHYFTPEDDKFYIGICNNYEHKYESVYNQSPDKLMIRPSGQFKKIVTNYKGTWINGYQGVIEAMGSSRTLEFLYNTGMGAKNPQGFGFLKIL